MPVNALTTHDDDAVVREGRASTRDTAHPPTGRQSVHGEGELAQQVRHREAARAVRGRVGDRIQRRQRQTRLYGR